MIVGTSSSRSAGSLAASRPVCASGSHRGRAQLRVERTSAGASIVVKTYPALYKATDGGRRLKLAADIESGLLAAGPDRIQVD